MKFKVGDRVILDNDSIQVNGDHMGIGCQFSKLPPGHVVIKESKVLSNRYCILFKNVLNRDITFWVDSEDLKLDVQYYRDLKLEQLLS